MEFFRKDRKVFGMSFLFRMMVAVLVVGIVGVSGTVLMADWVDDDNINSNSADQLFIDDTKENLFIYTKRFRIDNIGSAHLVLYCRNEDNSFKDWW